MFEHNTIDFPKCTRKVIDGRRVYVTPDGNYYPSITSVLQQNKHQDIERWKKRVGEEEASKVRISASNRGDAVHSIAEKYLKNDINFLKGAMPTNSSLFRSIKPIIDKYIGVVYGIEQSLYSDILKVAGTADVIASWNGDNAIVDFKTSFNQKKPEKIHNYYMQLGGYGQMVNEHTNLNIKKVAIIMACDYDQPIVFVKNLKPCYELLTKFLKETRNDQHNKEDHID